MPHPHYDMFVGRYICIWGCNLWWQNQAKLKSHNPCLLTIREYSTNSVSQIRSPKLTWDLELSALNISKNTKHVKVIVVSRGVITLSRSCQKEKEWFSVTEFNVQILHACKKVNIFFALKWKSCSQRYKTYKLAIFLYAI